MVRQTTTTGTICVDDEYGFTYHIAKIEYIEREDETFQYIFTPNYSVMGLLSDRIFQGIPGLNLELKKERYVRDNMVPVFISERTPGENREDLWELLEKYDMDYLNRLEWLIRTDMRYAGDPMYVCRTQPKNLKVDSLNELGNRSAVISHRVLDVICTGGELITRDFTIDDSNRKAYYELFLSLYRTERKYLDDRRREGIKKSAEKGNYKGRIRIKVDSWKLQEAVEQYDFGQMTGEQAAEWLGVSKSTFIRRYREWKSAKETNI